MEGWVGDGGWFGVDGGVVGWMGMVLGVMRRASLTHPTARIGGSFLLLFFQKRRPCCWAELIKEAGDASESFA